MVRPAVMVVAVAALSGCAGMSEEDCLVADWRTVGFEDGADGRPVATIGDYREACGRHGVSPDLDSYRSGHAEGVEAYCRPGRGFEVGRRGASYQGVCPAELEPAFLDAYRSGRHLHELETGVRRIENAISRNQRERERIKQELTSIAAAIAGSETSSEERVALAAEAAELGNRHGELSAEHDDLLEEHAVAVLELEEYRDTLAFDF